jgi:hypothetical protein
MSVAKKLWSVTPEDNSTGFNHMRILAQTMTTAIKKAQQWLSKNGFKTIVKKVEFHGTIDVF